LEATAPEADGVAEADGNRTHRTLLACRWF
jgi:hypothetical protein